VRRSADPGCELQHGISPIDTPIEGILIGEHALRESLTDDSNGIVLLAVGIVEITAGDDGNAERGKESGRDDAHMRARVFIGDMNMTIGGELHTETEAGIAPRSNPADSGGGHTGSRLHDT